MRIIDLQPVADHGAGTRTLAVFDLELTDEVKLYGMRLLDRGGRRLTYAASANGGRRTATFAPALAERITAAANSELERQVTANASRH